MKVAEGFHVEWVEDEAVLLDATSGSVHYLNSSAALFYALCLEHGIDGARDAVRERFGAEVPDEEVDGLVDWMREKGILVDD